MRRSRGEAAAIAGIVVATILCWVRWSPLDANDLVGGDEGYYGTMAKNILASPRFLVSPSLTPLGPPGDKPPLYPLLLAASIRVFGAGEGALRWLSIAGAALIAFACARLASRAAGPLAGVACAAFLVTLPWLADASRVVAAEIPLTALGAVALTLVCRERVSPGVALAAGVLLGLAFLCKLWLALLIAVPAASALGWPRERRAALPWLIGGACATGALQLAAVAWLDPQSLPHWWGIYVGRSLSERIRGEGYAPYWRPAPAFYWSLLAHAFVLLLPLVAVGLDCAARRMREPACRALVIWALGAAVLSAFRVKSGGYAYTVVPAWGALAAIGAHALAEGRRLSWVLLALVALAGSPVALARLGGEPLPWTPWAAAWCAAAAVLVASRRAGALARPLAIALASALALAGFAREAQRLPRRYHATGYRAVSASLAPMLREVAPERRCFVAPEAPAWSYYWFRTGSYWGTPVLPWSDARRREIVADTAVRVFVVDARQSRYGGWPDSATVRWLEQSTREVTADFAGPLGPSSGLRVFLR